MLRLTAWIAAYYLCPWGQVLEAVVPAGVRGQAGTRKTSVASLAPDVASRLAQLDLPKTQAHVIRVLAEAGRPIALADLMRLAHCSHAPIAALRTKGWLTIGSEREPRRREPEPAVTRQKGLHLNPDQQRALEAIRGALASREHQTILIHGVTGSGKTEVYIQAIEEVVAFRPAGDRARAGNQPHAADAGAVPLRGSTAWPCCTAI